MHSLEVCFVAVLLIAMIDVVDGYRKSTCLNTARGVCDLPLRGGDCHGRCPRFHYDATKRKCIPFTYSSCGGNANNFKSLSLCHSVCESRVCPAVACFVSPCEVETCPRFSGAVCQLVCPCQSVWLYDGEDVTDRCNNRG